MSILYPTALDDGTSLPNPTATNDTNSPSLSSGQDLQNTAIIALETKVGTGASTPPGDNYVLTSPTSGASNWGPVTPANAAGSTTGSGEFVLSSGATINNPTINAPTINNPVLKTDSVLGFTTANSGTVYGVSVTSGKVAGADISNIPYASLLSNIFSGQVQSYANSGTAGGSGYYVNLGGIKLYWGTTARNSSYNSPAWVIDLPTGFFTSVTQINLTPTWLSTDVTQVANVAGELSTITTNFNYYASSIANSPAALQSTSWFVIGT